MSALGVFSVRTCCKRLSSSLSTHGFGSGLYFCSRSKASLPTFGYRGLTYIRSTPWPLARTLPSLDDSSYLNNKQVWCRHCVTERKAESEILDQPVEADPYGLVRRDLNALAGEIKEELRTDVGELYDVSGYHFDGAGKYFRPMIVMLIAKACNIHSAVTGGSLLLPTQRKVAMISEMIHTASLMHDDVIDVSDTRRGQPTVQKSWGQRKAILAGDYVLSVASVILAKLGNEEVVKVLSQVLEDLVAGEFMQLGSKEEETERFNHYLKKTYKKTASLIANSCKAVAILGQCAEHIVEIAYEYGRNVGIAFQLVDDLLDFVSNENIMGKPASADLKLGLATAPVLYAAHQYDEINAMIMRRFAEPGDVQRTLELVSKSDGIRHTRFLAEQHCKESIRYIMQLCPSIERDALVAVTQRVLNRLK